MIPLCLCVVSVWAANDLSHVNELGPVRVTTTLSPREPTIGDEIVLEIQVQAAQGVDVLMPEFGEALSRYTILDFVPKQKVRDDGSTVHSQRYTLQPYVSGEQSIPPILVEFVDHRPGEKPTPDDLDAYEILTDRFDFQVKSVLPANASTDLNPPLGELELAPSAGDAVWRFVVPATLVALAALVTGIIVWRRRRARARRRDPYDVARERLDQLLAHRAPRDEVEMETFFVEISAIIRRYLEDRFELRAPELTTEEFLAVAGDSGALSHEHQKLLRDFLRQADLVKFAGVRASEQDIRLSTEYAIRFLEETRSKAAKLDAQDAMEHRTVKMDTSPLLEPVESISDSEENANA